LASGDLLGQRVGEIKTPSVPKSAWRALRKMFWETLKAL
jgi:hypothetical protein